MELDTIFKTFCDSLNNRKELMTEDNVRYYWFASMLKEDPELEHYTMEYPYNTEVFEQIKNRARKELDFLYLNGDESYCMEIKFHRDPDPNSTFAHTDAAGSLFNDIIRLALFEPGKAFNTQKKTCNLPTNTKRLFLYVTDGEMSSYLNNETHSTLNAEFRNELTTFFTMAEGGSYQQIAFSNAPDTFVSSALDALDKQQYDLKHIPRIRLLHKNSFDNMRSESFWKKQCHIRLYEIQPNYLTH